MLNLLIVEGNSPEINARLRELGARLQSELFEALLREAPDVRTETLFAADEAVSLPPEEKLAAYDGILWTGAALNLPKGEPAALRQVELARRALRAGAFIYGSCWGLQVVAVACGGRVIPNPRGREIGIARDITLTDAGRRHPLLRGRPGRFDALAVHRDIVAPLPEDTLTVLAGNDLCPIQAAELRLGKGRFWGVQYHPEYDFLDLAAAFRRYAPALVEEGLFPDLEAVEAEARRYESAAAAGPATGLAAIPTALADPAFRTLEIHNWLAALRTP